jgi:DNA repair exonuclease SbcCD ATPase subunit
MGITEVKAIIDEANTLERKFNEAIDTAENQVKEFDDFSAKLSTKHEEIYERLKTGVAGLAGLRTSLVEEAAQRTNNLANKLAEMEEKHFKQLTEAFNSMKQQYEELKKIKESILKTIKSLGEDLNSLKNSLDDALKRPEVDEHKFKATIDESLDRYEKAIDQLGEQIDRLFKGERLGEITGTFDVLVAESKASVDQCMANYLEETEKIKKSIEKTLELKDSLIEDGNILHSDIEQLKNLAAELVKKNVDSTSQTREIAGSLFQTRERLAQALNLPPIDTAEILRKFEEAVNAKSEDLTILRSLINDFSTSLENELQSIRSVVSKLLDSRELFTSVLTRQENETQEAAKFVRDLFAQIEETMKNMRPTVGELSAFKARFEEWIKKSGEERPTVRNSAAILVENKIKFNRAIKRGDVEIQELKSLIDDLHKFREAFGEVISKQDSHFRSLIDMTNSFISVMDRFESFVRAQQGTYQKIRGLIEDTNRRDGIALSELRSITEAWANLDDALRTALKRLDESMKSGMRLIFEANRQQSTDSAQVRSTMRDYYAAQGAVTRFYLMMIEETTNIRTTLDELAKVCNLLSTKLTEQDQRIAEIKKMAEKPRR